MAAKLSIVVGVLLSLLSPALAQIQLPEGPLIIVPQMPPVRGGAVQLTGVDVDVDIDGSLSTTVVSLTLTNPTRGAAEAQVLMPVPDGAVVRQFVLEGMGEKGIAEILAKDEARRIYESIVSKMRDPGLLEFVGQGVMKSSVFPVPANGEQVVSLTYEQVLPMDGDRIDYAFPRSGSLGRSGATWTMHATIEAPRPIAAVYSPTHDLVTERISPTKVRVTVPSASVGGTLALSMLLESADGLSATMLAYPDPELAEAGYFLLLAGLPPVAPEDVKPVKREVTLVIDRSGSMRGDKIKQVREAALQVLAGLEDGEAFNIVDYSDTVEAFSAAPVLKSAKSMQEAEAYLDSLRATGGTNIHDALLEALRPEPREGFLPLVLFLTDGLPTVGVRSESAIRDAVAASNAHSRRIFTFGVGSDVNAPLLTNIASTSRATTTFVLPDEDVEVKVGQVFRRLKGPVLAMPEITAVDADGEPVARRVRDLLPGALPDLFEGDQLVLVGRFMPEAGDTLRLKLTGEYFGDARTFEFSFDTSKATVRNANVPRLWASRKIGALIDEIRQAGANGHMPGEEPALSDDRMKELVDEIVRLSIRWGILTEYTAFLAVPEEDMRANIDTFTANFGVPATRMEGAPAAPNRDAAFYALRRSQRARAGEDAVRQEANIQGGFRLAEKSADALQNREQIAFLGFEEDESAKLAANITIVADQTFFNRDNRWLQAELVEAEDQEPAQVIEYGTEAYDTLVDELVAEGRVGLLAMRGEILMIRGGRNVLVRGPEPITP